LVSSRFFLAIAFTGCAAAVLDLDPIFCIIKKSVLLLSECKVEVECYAMTCFVFLSLL
jgi:hypothetical protein